jgi:hypothetical protein
VEGAIRRQKTGSGSQGHEWRDYRGVEMRTTRRSSLPRYVRSDWLYARNPQGRGDDRGVEMRTTLRSSLPRAMCVATGFMPGISRDGATTRKSSLPRYVRSDWLYARNQQGRCDYRGVKPLATLVATGFMPGWIAGWKCGRRGGRPSRAVCVATGFMPGISRDEATIAEVVPPARCA